jgi:hypothetical protein
MIEHAKKLDVRGWLMLIWVAWFGTLYARMYLAAKGGLALAVLGRLARELAGLGR